MEDDKKKIVYWINKNEQYILDILQLDSVISGNSLYRSPSISDLIQSFVLYSYIMQSNYEDLREKLTNNLSNNIKMPLTPIKKGDQKVKNIIRSLRILPLISPKEEDKKPEFNNQRVIAVNFKGFNYTILKSLIEELSGGEIFQGGQYALIKSIFQLFVNDVSFLSTFRDHAFITYIYGIPLLDSFYLFFEGGNIPDTIKIKKIILDEMSKDISIWESYKERDPIDIFLNDLTLNNSKKFYFSRVLFNHYLIDLSNIYISKGKYYSLSYFLWKLFKELNSQEKKEEIIKNFRSQMNDLLKMINNFYQSVI
jgi:hypothetical protein